MSQSLSWLPKHLPGVTGVLAPFVAASGGLFPQDQWLVKIGLMVIGLLLGIASLAASILNERAKDAASLALRHGLAELIADGLKLTKLVRKTADAKTAKDAVDGWQQEISNFVGEKLGKPHVIRLNNPVGIELDERQYLVGDKQKNRLLMHVQIRLRRLDEFLKEVS
jgi:hypothetical protein